VAVANTNTGIVFISPPFQQQQSPLMKPQRGQHAIWVVSMKPYGVGDGGIVNIQHTGPRFLQCPDQIVSSRDRVTVVSLVYDLNNVLVGPKFVVELVNRHVRDVVAPNVKTKLMLRRENDAKQAAARAKAQAAEEKAAAKAAAKAEAKAMARIRKLVAASRKADDDDYTPDSYESDSYERDRTRSALYGTDVDDGDVINLMSDEDNGSAASASSSASSSSASSSSASSSSDEPPATLAATSKQRGTQQRSTKKRKPSAASVVPAHKRRKATASDDSDDDAYDDAYDDSDYNDSDYNDSD
jgi:hypothetical protein